jgi:DNA-binding CsgD family transcriptional regulator
VVAHHGGDAFVLRRRVGQFERRQSQLSWRPNRRRRCSGYRDVAREELDRANVRRAVADVPRWHVAVDDWPVSYVLGRGRDRPRRLRGAPGTRPRPDRSRRCPTTRRTAGASARAAASWPGAGRALQCPSGWLHAGATRCSRRSTAATHRASGVESLTPSERRVAQLAADGLTNRAIAQERLVTEKTAERHLAHAFDSWGCARAHNCPTHWARRAPPTPTRATEHNLRLPRRIPLGPRGAVAIACETVAVMTSRRSTRGA